MPALFAGQKLSASALNLLLDPPRLFTFQTTTQSVPNITWAAINFQAEVYDTIAGHSTITNITRYLPNVSGTYDIIGQVTYATNSTNDRACQARKNGSPVDGLQYGGGRASASTNVAGMAWCFGSVALNGTTDYLELYAFQDSGGSLNTNYAAGFTSSFLKAIRTGS